jgi:hypothetical protein
VWRKSFPLFDDTMFQFWYLSSRCRTPHTHHKLLRYTHFGLNAKPVHHGCVCFFPGFFFFFPDLYAHMHTAHGTPRHGVRGAAVVCGGGDGSYSSIPG